VVNNKLDTGRKIPKINLLVCCDFTTRCHHFRSKRQLRESVIKPRTPFLVCAARNETYADLKNSFDPQITWETKVKRPRTASTFLAETVELRINESILSSMWFTLVSSTPAVQKGSSVDSSTPRKNYISSRQFTLVLIDGHTQVPQKPNQIFMAS
jgi:hypothetical protein